MSGMTFNSNPMMFKEDGIGWGGFRQRQLLLGHLRPSAMMCNASWRTCFTCGACHAPQVKHVLHDAHVHMLLWTRERVQPSLLPTQLSADDVEHLTDDEVADRIQPRTVEDLTDKFICTTTPERWKNVHLKCHPERADYKCLSRCTSMSPEQAGWILRRTAALQGPLKSGELLYGYGNPLEVALV
ncbi:pfh1 [Symbiodinium sp. CCMP2456]|nr:pfh1 [Symbiodinium sp. CCMP2456]